MDLKMRSPKNRYGHNEQQDNHLQKHQKKQVLQALKSHGSFNLHQRSTTGEMDNHISLNLSKMIPKKHVHNMQTLYVQNYQLRFNIQQLKQEVIKLKTRLNFSQKSKNRVLKFYHQSNQCLPFHKQKTYKNVNSDRFDQYQQSSQTQKKIKNNEIYDQLFLLKNQNFLLKKTVKYTETKQLTIQIEHLTQQCQKFQQVLHQRTLNHKKDIDNYETIIKDLKLQLDTQIKKSKYMQLDAKKKIDQICILKMDLCTAKKRDRLNQTKLLKFKKGNLSSTTQPIINEKQLSKISVNCSNCKRLENQRNQQKQKNQSLIKLSKQLNQYKQKCSTYSKSLKQFNQQKEKRQTCISFDKQRNQNKQKCQNCMKLSKQLHDYKQKRQSCVKLQKQLHQYKRKCSQIEKQIYDLHQNQPQLITSIVLQSHKDKVDIQKSQIQITQQQVQPSLQTTLQQTIKYRMMKYRYTFKKYRDQIKKKDIKQFSASQVKQLISIVPLLLSLNEQHFQYAILNIFGHLQKNMNDIIKTDDLLEKLRFFMVDFQQLPKQSPQILFSCQKRIISQKNALTTQFQNLIELHTRISKTTFIKIFKQFNFTSQQIQILLTEASILSQTIQNINYQALLNKLCDIQRQISKSQP